jgi:hypothetical protein
VVPELNCVVLFRSFIAILETAPTRIDTTTMKTRAKINDAPLSPRSDDFATRVAPDRFPRESVRERVVE